MNKKICLYCTKWLGDRQKMESLLKTYGNKVMSWSEGWPESGGCSASSEWLDLTVIGNACVDVKVPANFGCVLHEKYK